MLLDTNGFQGHETKFSQHEFSFKWGLNDNSLVQYVKSLSENSFNYTCIIIIYKTYIVEIMILFQTLLHFIIRYYLNLTVATVSLIIGFWAYLTHF